MPGQQKGFTLLEILVVVFIIAIIMSISVLSLNLVRDDRDLRNEAQRLISLIELAQDEGVLQGREFGIEFLRGGYRFVEYDPFSGAWADVPFDDELRLRTLPEDMELDLVIEDRRIALESDAAMIADPDDDSPTRGIQDYSPHLYIFSSGDMTAFNLFIYRQFSDDRVAIEADVLGNIEFSSEGEEID